MRKNKFSVFAFMIIFFGSCKPGNYLSVVKSDHENEYTLTKGVFRNCNYIRASSKNKNYVREIYTIDFNCSPKQEIYIRKAVYNENGKYIKTEHAVTDTSKTLKFLNFILISELQSYKVKNTFKSITSQEANLLNAIREELINKKYQFKIPDSVGNKIIGWVHHSN